MCRTCKDGSSGRPAPCESRRGNPEGESGQVHQREEEEEEEGAVCVRGERSEEAEAPSPGPGPGPAPEPGSRISCSRTRSPTTTSVQVSTSCTATSTSTTSTTSSTTTPRRNVQPALQPPPPRKVPAERLQQLQKKRALPPEPPALFTFTPLKGVKAKPQDFKPQDFKEKDPKLKLKKENTEANVKHAELNKKKEPRPHNENVKSLTLEEYLLKKKKKKKKHREDEHSAKKIRYMRNKAVQTVCAGLGADLTLPVCPDTSPPGTVKHETNRQPAREAVDNHQPYLHALKLGHVPFLSHQDHYIRSSCLQTGTWYGRFMHEERQANGGGLVLHAYADELACLSPAQMECFAQEFLELGLC
ncbi:Lysine-specific demethylase 9 [Larimichthys crocea]|uniref:Uncharacterized protein n=1 Tax=Larimichthys crocea TaxID=215358 RepID=A0ACD3R9A5_LARCR|nr:Lysine-specific demethylase 9 [Larimichthys crocea]